MKKSKSKKSKKPHNGFNYMDIGTSLSRGVKSPLADQVDVSAKYKPLYVPQ